MTQYPGPDDPFSRPPNESGHSGQRPVPASPISPASGDDETAPVQHEEIGYWERKAREEQRQRLDADQQQAPSATPSETSPGGSGGPYAAPPPPYGQPGPPGYGGTNPTTPYPVPVPGPTGYGQPAYGQPAYPGYAGYAQQPNHPSANTALVLGLIGLIGGCLCGLPLLVAPFAWATGARAKREIDASHGQLGGGGNAQAGYVMGIIGTVLLVLAVLALIGLVVIGIVTDSSSSTGSTTF